MVKAWEIDNKKLELNKMNVPSQEEANANWEMFAAITSSENALWKRVWDIQLPSSGARAILIAGLVSSVEALGYDVSSAEELLEKGLEAFKEDKIEDLIEITARIYRSVTEAKKVPDHKRWKFKEYRNFEEFTANAKLETLPIYDIYSKDYEDRTYAGWCAQIAGGMLGSQLEAYTTEEIVKSFPRLNNYICPPSTYNDDITFEIAFLEAFHKCGKELVSADVALKWLSLIPFGMTAEGVALQNLKSGVFPPMSAELNNPFREWIGAQMRAAICGQVAPGNPYEAARYAWLDGSISHVNNGIIGEIFNAVMVSLAYVDHNVPSILTRTLNMLPCESEYFAVVNKAFEACQSCSDWREAWEICREDNKMYNWIHAYPNAAAEVVALWYGDGDFDRTIEIICQEGMDTDCNAAQVMHVVGTAVGIENIDPKWLSPIDDKIVTYMRGFPELSLKELSRKTVEAARKALK